MASKLADAFFETRPRAVIPVEDTDYALLREAAEEPQRSDRATGQIFRGYVQPQLLQQVGSFIEAIQNATEKPPEALPPRKLNAVPDDVVPSTPDAAAQDAPAN
jgi:hypothetical protein